LCFIASIIGTVLQQNQSYSDYLIKFGPFWFDVFEKAGLYDDAQTMYTELLRFIASDSRKAYIKQEIQQIRLLRNAEKTKSKEI